MEKMVTLCIKLLGDKLSSRNFDSQFNEIDLPENKKQSNTASLQWGLKTPSNKMPVKIYACKPTFVQNWKLRQIKGCFNQG
ncbi:MAG: hypothetical protein L0G51_03725 [Lactococcus lactis]|jgi:hypothetical protein|nr:hypothetical protein [Lactococcus lactis]